MLDSTVWLEDGATRLVWITLLLLKDQHGIVKGFVPKTLANRARVSYEECLKALETFMSPDADSQSKVDEGRRIREVPGGWFVINHEEYRFSTEAKKAFWRQEKADQRSDKESRKKNRKRARPPTFAETLASRGEYNGETVETLDLEMRRLEKNGNRIQEVRGNEQGPNDREQQPVDVRRCDDQGFPDDADGTELG